MENEDKISWKTKLKKKVPLLVFLSLSTAIFFLASTLLLEDSYTDIFLIAMIWALPLFIH
ncbi:MAG: hypothetical protein HUK19_02045 [Fibrobacter sp.]|nr:hypothetical protein [Fibrobacter sp.]